MKKYMGFEPDWVYEFGKICILVLCAFILFGMLAIMSNCNGVTSPSPTPTPEVAVATATPAPTFIERPVTEPAWSVKCNAGGSMTVKYSGEASRAKLLTYYTSFDSPVQYAEQWDTLASGSTVTLTLPSCSQGDAEPESGRPAGHCFFDKGGNPTSAQAAVESCKSTECTVLALDLRDRETEGHTQRVTTKTEELARALGFTEEEITHIRRGALLHDMRKMGIPDEILQKPGPLTDDEWVIMRRHPEMAYQMLSQIKYLKEAITIPYYHHERWDGSGYPHKLKGEDIPLQARMFAVVDVWDALSSDRPYRKKMHHKEVVEYLLKESGRLFDPQVIEIFIPMISKNSRH